MVIEFGQYNQLELETASVFQTRESFHRHENGLGTGFGPINEDVTEEYSSESIFEADCLALVEKLKNLFENELSDVATRGYAFDTVKEVISRIDGVGKAPLGPGKITDENATESWGMVPFKIVCCLCIPSDTETGLLKAWI